MDTILSHLATTIMYDMSPRAFLEKYLVTSPVLQVPAVTMLINQCPKCESASRRFQPGKALVRAHSVI